MTTIMLNERTKIEAIEFLDHYVVTTYELMGGRWVALGNSEKWDKELFREEFA